MPYKDRTKQLKYWREYRKKNPQYKSKEYKGKGSIGYEGELFALTKLEGAERIIHPSDIRWGGKLIDVKTGTKIKHGKKGGFIWKFLLKHQKGKIDLYFIICLGLDRKVEHIFLIPDSELEVTNLTISEGRIAKYYKYRLALL